MHYFKISLGLTTMDKKTRFSYETAIKQVAIRLRRGGFDGASFGQKQGFWKGEVEDTLIIEIYDDESKLPIVQDMCEGLKLDFQQEMVLLNHEPAKPTLFI